MRWRRATSRSRWWARQDSNLQPRDYESPALTIVLQAHAAPVYPTHGRVEALIALVGPAGSNLQPRDYESPAPGNLGSPYLRSRCVSNPLLRGIGPQAISGIWTRSVTTQQRIGGATHRMIIYSLIGTGSISPRAVLLLPCVHTVHGGRSRLALQRNGSPSRVQIG